MSGSNLKKYKIERRVAVGSTTKISPIATLLEHYFENILSVVDEAVRGGRVFNSIPEWIRHYVNR